MNRYEIVEALARARRVEQIVEAVCRPHRPEHDDLCQMIYLILLERPEWMIEGLWESGGLDGAISWYIFGIVKKQYNLPRTAFDTMFRKFKLTELKGNEKLYDDDWWEKPRYERDTAIQADGA